MSNSWYMDFFEGLSVELWTRVVPAEQTQTEVAFLAKQLQLDDGARLLDVPCGDGRHAIGLAKLGFQVTGCDISEDFLGRARRQTAAASENVSWVHADMRALPDLGNFAGAYSMGNCLGYVDAEGTRSFFSSVYDALLPGGRFVLDTGMLAESILINLEDEMQYEVGDIKMQIAHTYNGRESRLDTTYTFNQGEREEIKHQWNWVFTAGELSRMLQSAGFERIEISSSLEGDNFNLGDRLAIVTASKR